MLIGVCEVKHNLLLKTFTASLWKISFIKQISYYQSLESSTSIVLKHLAVFCLLIPYD